MKNTRRSLWYPVSYLFGAALGLIVVPQVVLDLAATGDYEVFFPRMVGAAMAVLGVLVVIIILNDLQVMYRPIYYNRFFLAAIFIWLWFDSGDPFFLIVFFVVVLGLVFTSIALYLDNRSKQLPSVR